MGKNNYIIFPGEKHGKREREIVGRVMVHSDIDLESVTGAAMALQASPRHSLKFYIGVYWYYLVYKCTVHYIIKGKVGMFSKTLGCFLFL